MTTLMREIPIGVQDFKLIRERDGYFVDKSLLIDSILSRRLVAVHLFTRPRRFGKSVNLSMLDAYFNLRYRGNRWFDGLRVSDLRPDDPEKNSHPVIFMDFKELSSDGYDSTVRKARIVVAEVCKRFPELAEGEGLDPDDVRMFLDLKSQSANDEVLASSLALLSRMLEARFGRKAVILIDEYDNPLNRSYGEPDHRRITDFVRDMLSSGLKGNGSLAFGVVTGVMQIAKESIFSGLNNLRVNNILSTDMDEMFGFTQEEVERMCGDFGHPEKFAEAREWYDGYRFGNAEIYNPWSVLNYIDSGFVPAPYWAGTSDNGIIDDLLSVPDRETYDNLMRLGSGESIVSDLDPRITFADMTGRPGGVYSVMALSGYLTARQEGGRCMLSLPNREMYAVFADAVLSKLNVDGMGGSMRALSRSVLSGDVGTMERSLGDLLRYAVSGRVLDSEHAYQAFITGLLMSLHGNYEITADFESGDGYHDIRLRRLHGNGPNIVMELKRVRGSEDPERLARDALEQIGEREYTHGLSGRTVLYGIAFEGKTPTIASEVVDLRGL